MDICIFYFSGTGNTWWAANRLAEELKIRGRSVECHSIELLDIEKSEELINNSETIIFGYPIYGSCLPGPMKQFIDNLPEPIKNKNAGIFCTQMVFSGDGAWYYHKALENNRFDLKWTFHFILPSNICVKPWPLPYTADEIKISRIFKKCGGKIESAAEHIVSGGHSYTGNGIGSLLLGLMQRPFFKAYIKKERKSFYKADMGKCNSCMRCIQICPSGNIELTDGKITFGKECVLCMRCYNFCPKTAITAYGFAHTDKKLPYRGPNGFDPALIKKPRNLLDFIKSNIL